MPNLNNKVALITGARRGMGRVHALTLAKYGAKGCGCGGGGSGSCGAR